MEMNSKLLSLNGGGNAGSKTFIPSLPSSLTSSADGKNFMSQAY